MSNAPDDPSRRLGRSPFRAIGLLLFLYFVTRLVSLGSLPAFLDEAVHIQWADRLWSEGRVAKPVSAGRLLAVGAYGVALPFEDRLLAARALAVVVGAGTLLCLVALARRLFGDRAAWMAGGLYILSPFALVYDRLALSDGFLSAAIALLMLAACDLAARPQGWLHWFAAVAIPVAVLSKVSAVFFLATFPLGLLFLCREPGRVLRPGVVSLIVGLAAASPMLLAFASTGREIAAQHIADPVSSDGAAVAATLADMGGWVLGYFTPPSLIAAVLALLALRDRRAAWLALSAILPFVLFALFSEPWSARYVLPALPPFLLLLAGGLEALASRLARSAVAALALVLLASVSAVGFDARLLTNPAQAPFPEDDRRQLVTGWPSGYGIRELGARLLREAASGPIVVYVDARATRNVTSGLELIVGRSRSIRLVEADLASPDVVVALRRDAIAGASYAVVGPRAESFDFRASIADATGTAERVEVFERPGGEWAATLFRVRF